VDIVIDTTENVAGADIWLDYNSNIVEITAVDAVDFNCIVYTPIEFANANNGMKINWAGGLCYPETGNGLVYARITFSAEGSPGEETDLHLTVFTRCDPDLGLIINATTKNGTLRVADDAILCCDLNRDGEVTSEDALITLQIVVGGHEYDSSADMNRDGRITSTDALTILQVTLGT